MSAEDEALVGNKEADAPKADGVAAIALLWPETLDGVISVVFNPVPCVGVLVWSMAMAGAGAETDVNDAAGMATAESSLGGGASTGSDFGPAPGVTPPSSVGAAATGLGGGAGVARGGGGGDTSGGVIFGGVGGTMGGVGPVPGGTPTGSAALTGGGAT